MITGSISGAARMLFVSQPVVSRALAHLEKHLEITLFERKSGALVPTHEAQIIFQEIEEVYASALRVEELTQKIRLNKESRISFCASPTLGGKLIPLSIRTFMDQTPSITFDYKVSLLTEMSTDLLSGACDFAVSIWPINHPNLSCKTLFAGRMVLLVPEKHPLAQRETIELQDLNGQSMITYNSILPLGSFIQNLFNNAGIEVNSVVKMNSSTLARPLVQQGIGVALVNEFGVNSATEEGVRVKPVNFGMPASVFLITSKFEALSGEAKNFIQTICATFQQEIDRISLTPH